MWTTRYYLDYAASTPVHKEVDQAMRPYFSKKFANPNSIHQSGREAGCVVEKCEKQVRGVCNMEQGDLVLWSSGGSESNHLVIDYAITRWKQLRPNELYTVVISAVEHASVIDYLEAKKDPFLRIQHMVVDKYGMVDLRDLEAKAISWSNVALVSCVFQSSEVGTTQPIKKLFQTIKKTSQPGCEVAPVTHVDASQGLMYHKINIQDWEVDTVTLCGQKIYGPKGVGALLVSKKLETWFLKKEGTPAVPLIAGVTKALELAQTKLEHKHGKIVALRRLFYQALEAYQVNYIPNGQKEEASLVLNMSFPDDVRDSEQLVIAFDHAGLEVSSKSACMGSQAGDSRVLAAMGRHPLNSIRLCLHHSMSRKDITKIVRRIARLINS